MIGTIFSAFCIGINMDLLMPAGSRRSQGFQLLQQVLQDSERKEAVGKLLGAPPSWRH